MTRDEAKALYSKAIEVGYSDEEAKAAITKRMKAAPAPVAAPAQTSMGDDVFNYMNSEVQRETPGAPDMLQGLARGINRGSLGMVQGARKLYNQATGDDEAINRINQQNQLMQNQREARDPTGSGMSSEDVGALLSIMGTAGPVGAAAKGYAGAAGVGALEGALQPTTKDQSQLANIGAGAAGGVVGQGLGQAVGKGADMWRRTDVGTALEDFTKRALGVGREDPIAGQYDNIFKSVEAKRNELGEQFSKRYAQEGAASGGVNLQATSRLSDDALTLPEEVMNSLNPGAKRVMEALRRGSTHTSPILDPTGRAITLPKSVEFSEVRDAVRGLRKAKRAMPHTDAGVARGQQIDTLIRKLDDDISAWGAADTGMGPGNRDVLSGARQTDIDFANQVAPFDSRDEVIGQLRRGDGDEGAFNRLFLGTDKGQAVGELIDRVPATKEPARAIYGSKYLLKDRGDTAAMNQLEGGTTAEKLLTPEERAYTKLLAGNVRENKGSGGLDAGRLLRSLMHAPVVEGLGGAKLDKMLSGVLRYRDKPLDMTTINQLLRAYGGAEASGE